MHVRVDERRHHRLAGEIDAPRPAGGVERALRADLCEAAVLDDERGVLDRRAAIAGDDPRALEDALLACSALATPLSSGSSLTIDAPWLLPTQNVDRRRAVVHEHPPHVRRARQQVLDELAARRIEAQNAIVVLAAGPDVAVLVGGHVVRPRARRRHRPFLEALGPRVEHADAIAVVLAEPQAILRIHHPAAGSGARRRRLEIRISPLFASMRPTSSAPSTRK